LRNGMSLSNITGHLQTGVIGVLLILSVLIPNVIEKVKIYLKFRKLKH
jgi:rhamnose transport system permease protein